MNDCNCCSCRTAERTRAEAIAALVDLMRELDAKEKAEAVQAPTLSGIVSGEIDAR